MGFSAAMKNARIRWGSRPAQLLCNTCQRFRYVHYQILYSSTADAEPPAALNGGCQVVVSPYYVFRELHINMRGVVHMS